ncbi:MAG: hypothetical protein LAP87_06085 [Acidobacteriia bacterium]|nr:hypothetical protein [Terriglobia bacterium]
MSAQAAEVRVRSLPDGEFVEGREVSRRGSVLELEIANPGRELSQGALLEIESGSMLYLGELQQWSGSKVIVLVEHSLDRSKLSSIQESWG